MINNVTIDGMINKIPSSYRFLSRPLYLGTSSCPTAIQQGTTHNISAVATGGTPGYIYQWYVDGDLKQTYPTTGTTNDTSHTFSHAFSESIGSHQYSTVLTDNCTEGAKTDSSVCNINIQSVPVRYSCQNDECVEDPDGIYDSLPGCQTACPCSTGAKCGEDLKKIWEGSIEGIPNKYIIGAGGVLLLVLMLKK